MLAQLDCEYAIKRHDTLYPSRRRGLITNKKKRVHMIDAMAEAGLYTLVQHDDIAQLYCSTLLYQIKRKKP